jgi:hypothetical protein
MPAATAHAINTFVIVSPWFLFPSGSRPPQVIDSIRAGRESASDFSSQQRSTSDNNAKIVPHV